MMGLGADVEAAAAAAAAVVGAGREAPGCDMPGFLSTSPSTTTSSPPRPLEKTLKHVERGMMRGGN
jgi:hypothetical protein